MSDFKKLLDIKYWRAQWQKYAVKVVYWPAANNSYETLAWRGDSLQRINEGEAISIGPFGRAICLIPASDTLFKRCSFPADIVARADLTEAIELDIAQWSPWAANSGFCFYPQLHENEWHISIWVWDKQRQEHHLQSLLSDGHEVTHVLPQDLWVAAALNNSGEPAICVYQHQQQLYYQHVNAQGCVVSVTQVASERHASMFWRSLGTKADSIEQLFIYQSNPSVNLSWLPSLPPIDRSLSWPVSPVVERGNLPGVRDWRDPLSWKPAFFALAALLVIWMLGSVLIVWGKEQQIAAALASVNQDAQEVLDARDKVESLTVKITALAELKHRQQLPVDFLQQLAARLPEDVWLQGMLYKSDTVEIRGLGKNAAALAGMLEQMPLVSRVGYIGDIRPDATTGQEFFALRIYINQGDKP